MCRVQRQYDPKNGGACLLVEVRRLDSTVRVAVVKKFRNLEKNDDILLVLTIAISY